MRTLFRQIQDLDLESYPVDEINRLLVEFGQLPLMVTDYEEGKMIHRARPILDNENITSVSGLKYVPHELNTNYLRASTPNNTMFYGATVSETDETPGITNPRLTSAMETCSFLRDISLDGRQRLLYGKWRLLSRISLITILFTHFRSSRNQWIKTMSEEYFNYLQNFPDDQRKRYKQISNFLSSEFSRCVDTNENYKYLVSSLITRKLIEAGYDGVLYPSVRSMKVGLNVAIKPEVVDERMELISVLECDVHKRNKKVIINNLRSCLVSSGSETFNLEVITDANLRFTDEEINRRLTNS